MFWETRSWYLACLKWARKQVREIHILKKLSSDVFSNGCACCQFSCCRFFIYCILSDLGCGKISTGPVDHSKGLNNYIVLTSKCWHGKVDIVILTRVKESTQKGEPMCQGRLPYCHSDNVAMRWQPLKWQHL